MDNQIFDNEQTINIIQYIKENLPGLILLVLALFIIYFVDYINQLNALIYLTPSPIPGLPSSTTPPQQNSKRKLKKY